MALNIKGFFPFDHPIEGASAGLPIFSTEIQSAQNKLEKEVSQGKDESSETACKLLYEYMNLAHIHSHKRKTSNSDEDEQQELSEQVIRTLDVI